jgi:hypothetical protein
MQVVFRAGRLALGGRSVPANRGRVGKLVDKKDIWLAVHISLLFSPSSLESEQEAKFGICQIRA